MFGFLRKKKPQSKNIYKVTWIPGAERIDKTDTDGKWEVTEEGELAG